MNMKRRFSSFFIVSDRVHGYTNDYLGFVFFYFKGTSRRKQNRFNERHFIFRLEELAESTQKQKAVSMTFQTRGEWA